MTGKTTNLILLGIVVGVILGGVLGAVASDAMLAAAIIGKLYLNALTFIAVLLILFGLPLAVARYGDLRTFSGTASKSFVLTLVSAVAAIAVGVVIVKLIAAQAIGGSGMTASTSYSLSDFRITGDYLGTLVPEGIMRSVLQGKYLGWILFALVFGLVLPTIASRGRNLQMVLEEGNDAVLRIAELLLFLAPIGILFLTGALVALAGGSLGEFFGGYGWYPVALILAATLFGALALPALVRWWRRQPEAATQRAVPARGGRPEFAFAGGRQGRPGQSGRYDSRSRDGRHDRDRDRDRDRGRGDRGRDSFRKDRPDRPDRPDRVDRPDRPDRPERRTREESPFAVAAGSHSFDPEASTSNAPEATPPVLEPITETRERDERQAGRPEGSSGGRRDRDRDRGPRGRRDRDRRERGGRGRDRGRDRGRRPDHSPFGQEEQEPAAGPMITLRETGEYNASPDLSAGSEQAAGGQPDNLPEAMPSGTDRLVGSDRVAGESRHGDDELHDRVYGTQTVREDDSYRSPLGNETPERPQAESSEERDVSYGRSSRHHHVERDQEERDQTPSEPSAPASGDTAPKPIDSYSTEGIEFGRNRRKRTR